MRENYIAENNLSIIRNKNELKKIPSANVVLNKNITLLRPIIVTLNKKVMKNDRTVMLKNGNQGIQISKSEIINDQNKVTKKKLNAKIVSNLIVLACLAGCIRKVSVKGLNYFTADRIEKNGTKYKEKPIYEILDLRECHFERLKGMNSNTCLTHAIVCELYDKKIADNCFNRLFGTNNKVKYSAGIKQEILTVLKQHDIVQFSKMIELISNWRIVERDRDGAVCNNHQSKSWWDKNIKELFKLGTFDDVHLKLCRYSEVKKSIKKELPGCRGNSLVIVKN